MYEEKNNLLSSDQYHFQIGVTALPYFFGSGGNNFS